MRVNLVLSGLIDTGSETRLAPSLAPPCLRTRACRAAPTGVNMDRSRMSCVLRCLRLLLVAGAVAVASGVGAFASVTWPPALVSALFNDGDAAIETCAQSSHAASHAAYAQTNFNLHTVALRSGPQMFVLEGGGSCVCGQNCKVEIFARQGDAYTSVLSTYGISAEARPDGSAVITVHDSADVIFRATYRWNGTKYVDVHDEEVLYARNIAKPALRKIAFAPGASSEVVTGTKLAAGFEDHYQLDGAAGQTATFTLVARDTHFDSVTIIAPGGTELGTFQRGTLSVKLPETGTYALLVNGADEQFSKYALEIAIH